jgi:hypothetical protein
MFCVDVPVVLNCLRYLGAGRIGDVVDAHARLIVRRCVEVVAVDEDVVVVLERITAADARDEPRLRRVVQVDDVDALGGGRAVVVDCEVADLVPDDDVLELPAVGRVVVALERRVVLVGDVNDRNAGPLLRADRDEVPLSPEVAVDAEVLGRLIGFAWPTRETLREKSASRTSAHDARRCRTWG